MFFFLIFRNRYFMYFLQKTLFDPFNVETHGVTRGSLSSPWSRSRASAQMVCVRFSIHSWQCQLWSQAGLTWMGAEFRVARFSKYKYIQEYKYCVGCSYTKKHPFEFTFNWMSCILSNSPTWVKIQPRRLWTLGPWMSASPVPQFPRLYYYFCCIGFLQEPIRPSV